MGESKILDDKQNSDRYYCPYPGCTRSFAELWRLKVHYRAPPDIRGSGKERGHGQELTHCPKCNNALKPGKHHVQCVGKQKIKFPLKRHREEIELDSGIYQPQKSALYSTFQTVGVDPAQANQNMGNGLAPPYYPVFNSGNGLWLHIPNSQTQMALTMPNMMYPGMTMPYHPHSYFPFHHGYHFPALPQHYSNIPPPPVQFQTMHPQFKHEDSSFQQQLQQFPQQLQHRQEPQSKDQNYQSQQTTPFQPQQQPAAPTDLPDPHLKVKIKADPTPESKLMPASSSNKPLRDTPSPPASPSPGSQPPSPPPRSGSLNFEKQHMLFDFDVFNSIPLPAANTKDMAQASACDDDELGLGDPGDLFHMLFEDGHDMLATAHLHTQELDCKPAHGTNLVANLVVTSSDSDERPSSGDKEDMTNIGVLPGSSPFAQAQPVNGQGYLKELDNLNVGMNININMMNGVNSLGQVNGTNGMGVLNGAMGYNGMAGVQMLHNGQANKAGIDALQVGGEKVAWR